MTTPTHIVLTLEHYQNIGKLLSELPHKFVSRLIPYIEGAAQAAVEQDDGSFAVVNDDDSGAE